MSVVLPTGENNSGSNDWSDVYSNDFALKTAIEMLGAEVTDGTVVTTARLQNGAVIAEKLGDQAVTTAKIADYEVTPSKIAQLTTVSITSEELPQPIRRVHAIISGTAKSIAAATESGQLVTYLIKSSVTFKTSGNLKLASEFAAGEGDTITFAWYSSISKWCEVSRSNNA